MKSVILALSAMIAAAPAAAATLSEFTTLQNDGVFTLSAEQAAYMGAEDARYIGLLGVKLTGNERRDAADGLMFDDSTVMASLHKQTDPASVLGLVNGKAIGLAYAGDYLQPMGETGIATVLKQYDGAIGVLFAEAPVQFKGMPAFDGRRSAGLLAFLVPDRIFVEDPGYQAPVADNVPLPPAAAALGAALAGLGGLAALRRRSRGPA